jgi:DNA polymerase-3 subunit delta
VRKLEYGMSGSVYLVVGDEFQVAERARELADRLVPPDQAMMGREIIEADASTADEAVAVLGRCLSALQTVGLFSTDLLVWLKGAAFLAPGGAGGTQAAKPRLEALTALISGGLPPGQTLLITAPAVDKRTAFYKACRAAGEIIEFAVPEKARDAERAAAALLEDFLRGAGLRMRGEARQALLERAGTDSRQLSSEVQKLACYVGQRAEAGIEDVRAIVSATREGVGWDLADAVANRRLPQALALVRQLLFQGESAIGLIITLENRLLELRLFREGLDRGWLRITGGGRQRQAEWGPLPDTIEQTFAEDLGRDPRRQHPYRLLVLASQAAGFSGAALGRAVALAAETHARLVSSSLPPAWELEMFLVRLLAGEPAGT